MHSRWIFSTVAVIGGAALCLSRAVGMPTEWQAEAPPAKTVTAPAPVDAAKPQTPTPADRSAPESTVTAYLAAISGGDMPTALACIKNAHTSDFSDKAGLLLRSMHAEWHASSMVTIGSDAATTVSFQLTIRMTAKAGQPADTGASVAEKLTLTKATDGWLIVADDAARLSKMPAFMPSTFANLFVHPDSAGRSSMASVLGVTAARLGAVPCVEHLHELCVGILQYANDHDWKLPSPSAPLKTTLASYIKEPNAFVCPITGQPYVLNAALTGKQIIELPEMAKTVMVYEGKGGRPSFIHDGRAAIGFADGHCALLLPEEAKKVIWKP